MQFPQSLKFYRYSSTVSSKQPKQYNNPFFCPLAQKKQWPIVEALHRSQKLAIPSILSCRVYLSAALLRRIMHCIRLSCRNYDHCDKEAAICEITEQPASDNFHQSQIRSECMLQAVHKKLRQLQGKLNILHAKKCFGLMHFLRCTCKEKTSFFTTLGQCGTGQSLETYTN